jgi:HSP20 family molecular chaperone IbpA
VFGVGMPNITLEPGFPIDLEKSNASYRNGVIEITAVKAENHHESDGYLKVE